MQKKKDLRKIMLTKRTGLNSTKKALYDTQVCDALWSLIQTKKAKVVHSYLPMGEEINVWPLLSKLLENKIQVISPKTLKKRQLEHLTLHAIDDLEEGLWGTKHPANSTIYEGSIDLIIVPGLAFDQNKNRLGYGGGYYDNFMTAYPEAYKVAVCYPFQMLKAVPVEAHDFIVDEVCVLDTSVNEGLKDEF